MICTLYAHQTGFDQVVSLLQDFFPEGKLSLGKQDEFRTAEIKIKSGLLSPAKIIRISYRERSSPLTGYRNMSTVH